MNVQDLSYRTGVSEFSFDGENSISRHVVEAALFANPALQIPVSEGGFLSYLLHSLFMSTPRFRLWSYRQYAVCQSL